MKKRVLLSASLNSIDDLTTQTLIETLQACSDLVVVPPAEYDFNGNTLACYRYVSGQWQALGRRTPCCDIWIIWIDGYALDHHALGFVDNLAWYFAAQQFFGKNLACGNVGVMYNPIQAERNTLKDFMTHLDSEKFHTIPSFVVQDFDHLSCLYRTYGPLVVKPFWGGLRHGISRVCTEEALMALADQDLSNRVAQLFYSGPEKRLWIADGRCPQGGVHYGKNTPWSDFAPDYRAVPHDTLPADEVAADIRNAERMADEIGLRFGAVDFIGDRINEVNGSGTGYVMWNLAGEIVVDARPLLQAEILRLVAG
jgi:hypothetical protein